MKRNMKRVVALLLSVVMAVSQCPASVFADAAEDGNSVGGTQTTAEAELTLEGTGRETAAAAQTATTAEQVTTDASETEITGENDLGVLLADAITETEEEEAEQANYICDIVIEDVYATVSYQLSLEDVQAEVVVEIYAEEDVKMQDVLASGTADVSTDESSCTVELMDEIPDYFLVAAYLCDADTGEAVSETFVSRMYTAEMQEFMAMTVDDFEADSVINLDEDDTTNFMVYGENTIVMTEEADKNCLTDNGDGTYTITNADESFTSLKVGDVFTYSYEDGELLIVKVHEITVDGSTVTITEDENLELADVFDYIKIESNGSDTDEEVEVDTSELEDGVTYLGDYYAYDEESAEAEEASVQRLSRGMLDDIDIDARPVLKSASVQLNTTGVGTDSLAVGVSGTLSYKMGIAVKIYTLPDYQYISVARYETMGFSLDVGGDVILTIPFVKFRIPLLSGLVRIDVKPEIVIEFSGGLSLSGEVQTTQGIYYDSISGFGIFGENPECSMNVGFEGKLYIGLGEEVVLIACSEKIMSLTLSGTAGVQVAMEKQDNQPNEVGERHDCSSCFSGKISVVIRYAVRFRLLFAVTGFSGGVEYPLGDFYYSLDHRKFGWGSCPYNSWLCTILVSDDDGLVGGALITIDGQGMELVADEYGLAQCYLPNGTYVVNASDGTQTGSAEIVIDGEKQGVTVELSDEGASGGGSSLGAYSVGTGSAGDNVIWTAFPNGYVIFTGTGTITDHDSYYYYGDTYTYYSGIGYVRNKVYLDTYKVVITDGITGIGDEAFDFRLGLTSVTIPSSVTSIGEDAFHQCYALTDVMIPFGVISIGSDAFAYCTSLTDVTIPASVTSIGSCAFEGCWNLTSITIPSSVVSIENGAFGFCYDLTNVVIGEGVTSIGRSAFAYCTSLTDISIPDSVISIGDYAFERCNFTNVTLPSGITSIGEGIFSLCTSLTDIVIPSGVTSIGYSAFSGCSSLKSITIPSSVTSIGGSAFWDCSELESVTIPEGVTIIESSTFNDCTALRDITIPEGVTYIGSSAFFRCASLESVKIPNSVTGIGMEAFCDCTSMKSIAIPASVTGIGRAAFGYYRALDESTSYYETFRDEDFVIYGYKGSAGETYATDNEFQFVVLDETESEEPGTSENPSESKEPGVSEPPSESKEPGISENPSESEKPEASGTPSDGKTYYLGDTDMDGDVDVTDALAILKHYVKLNTLEGNALILADVTGEGNVDVADALAALKIYVKLQKQETVTFGAA